MGKYYTIKFFVDSFENVDNKVNQRKITEEVIDKICEILGCDYDKAGFLLWHPDYAEREIGKKYLKKNLKKFYKCDIPILMQGVKHPENYASSTLFFEKKMKEFDFYSDFIFTISYPIRKDGYLEIQIVVKESLLNDKNFTLDIYLNMLKVLTENNFKLNNSFVHYYRWSKSRNVVDGFDGFLYTWQENFINVLANNHVHNWKNKIVDVFLFNTFLMSCLNEEQLKELEELVGKENVIYHGEYITCRYYKYKGLYLLEKHIPSMKKIKLRKFFKKCGMMDYSWKSYFNF